MHGVERSGGQQLIGRALYQHRVFKQVLYVLHAHQPFFCQLSRSAVRRTQRVDSRHGARNDQQSQH